MKAIPHPVPIRHPPNVVLREFEKRHRLYFQEGYILVDPPPRDERTLQEWLDLAAAFVNTLPPKPPRSKPPAPVDKAV